MPSPFRAAGVVELPYILAIAIALACWLQGTLNVELTAPPPPPPPPKRRSFLSSVVGRFRRQKSPNSALALGSLSSWSLAKTIPGHEFLRVYTQKSGSKLKLRFHGHTRAGAAHFLALMHEVDLMPSWNAFVPWASVLEGSSDHDELVALAHVNPPWPVPTHHVLVRARLHADGRRRRRVADRLRDQTVTPSRRRESDARDQGGAQRVARAGAGAAPRAGRAAPPPASRAPPSPSPRPSTASRGTSARRAGATR